MSDLRNIVSVTIDRQTQSVSQAGFGVMAVIAKFSESKTTTEFDRYRYYSTLTEMTDDGWLSTDDVYKAAAALFSQNPRPDKIMVGRIDDADANLTASLAAIETAVQDWYGLIVIPDALSRVVFSTDFITGNTIDFTINGTAVTQVTFTTDHDTTMAAIVSQIESDVANSSVTLSDVAGDNRTLDITVDGYPAETVAITLGGGASQPTASINTGLAVVTEQNIKDTAAWTETQKKLFFFSSSDSKILDPADDTDIISFLKTQNYDRTIGIYHPNALGNVSPEMIEVGWPAESFPYDPGSQTWAYKTLASVATYTLTSGQRTAVLGKDGNIYTLTAGVAITEEGKVVSGEYIDIIRGIDWLEARLREAVFTLLVTVRKIPFTDDGITLVENAVRGVLSEAATNGLLVAESIVLTVPKAADVSTANKTNRILPDIKFTSILQGAIHKVEINGIVSV